jgi:hypothetical protein
MCICMKLKSAYIQKGITIKFVLMEMHVSDLTPCYTLHTCSKQIAGELSISFACYSIV